MTQTVLDFTAAREARDVALDQVEAGADEAWLKRAYWIVVGLSMNGAEFTTDDVWKVLEKPREPRALGAVLRSMAKQRFIERTGRYVSTAQVSRHHVELQGHRERSATPPEFRDQLLKIARSSNTSRNTQEGQNAEQD